MRLLFAVVVVDTLIGLVLRLLTLGDQNVGRSGWRGILAIVGLGWIGVLAAVLVRAWRHITRVWDHMAEQDEQLNAVTSISHEWIWQATPEMVATYSSPAVTELLGYRPEAIVGHPFSDFIHPDDLAAMRSNSARARRDAQGWSDLPLRWRRADGTYVTLHGSALPVVDHAGSLMGFRGVRRAGRGEDIALERVAEARSRVRAVLDSPEALTTAFQPIIDTHTGTMTGAEALARFADGRPPNVWFAEAHDAGVGLELELLALRAALSAAASLPARVYLSVNASPQLIVDRRFLELITDAPLSPERLVVEITEHAAISAYDDIDHALLTLRERGLRLAVDDTGAGYASFHHVLRLRPDVIKLDRSLITDVNTDPARRAFITAIVVLALELGASVTAEGIETRGELDALTTLGVDALQGYLLGRPSTDAETWRRWTAKRWALVDPLASHENVS